MYSLRIDPSWPQQIATIRNATTDDTNLIRFDNTFYRVCRAAPTAISVQLSPSDGQAHDQLLLEMGTRDFYVTQIGGRAFERYASTIDQLRPSASSLDNAVHAMRSATGDTLFQLQSLLVLCVAESIRSDHIATQIGQMISASRGQLLGVAPQLNVKDYLPQIRDWGQTCDAVWAALSPMARSIYTRPRAALTAEERRFSERVNENAISGEFRVFARAVKVLKRPASR
jgi:hypothetical protein